MRLEEMRPGQVREAATNGWPLVMPAGVIECHGHHLPCGCDAVFARELCYRVAEQIDCVVAPPIYYGPSTYCVGGPEMGSIDIHHSDFLPYARAVLRGFVNLGFQHIVVVIHHQGEGGEEALSFKLAGQSLWADVGTERMGRGWWGSIPPDQHQPVPTFHVIGTVAPDVDPAIFRGDHAGFYETALMLGFRPELVDMDQLGPDGPWYTLGRPDVAPACDATPEHGRRMIEELTTKLACEISRRCGL